MEDITAKVDESEEKLEGLTEKETRDLLEITKQMCIRDRCGATSILPGICCAINSWISRGKSIFLAMMGSLKKIGLSITCLLYTSRCV